MRSVHRDVLVGLACEAALLAWLAATAGLGVPGAAVGAAAVLVSSRWLIAALARAGSATLGPANRVTLARAVLVWGVAALIGDGLAGSPAEPAAVCLLAVPALALDAVDGWIARGTGSVTDVGGRFDMEVDAALILVLSIAVVPAVGGWVLGIGGARYAYGIAGLRLPWLRGAIPPSRWRKAVAAVQGVALVTVASGLLPGSAAVGLLAAAALLLVHSFAGQVWWLARHRAPSPVPARASAAQRA